MECVVGYSVRGVYLSHWRPHGGTQDTDKFSQAQSHGPPLFAQVPAEGRARSLGAGPCRGLAWGRRRHGGQGLVGRRSSLQARSSPHTIMGSQQGPRRIHGDPTVLRTQTNSFAGPTSMTPLSSPNFVSIPKIPLHPPHPPLQAPGEQGRS